VRGLRLADHAPLRCNHDVGRPLAGYRLVRVIDDILDGAPSAALEVFHHVPLPLGSVSKNKTTIRDYE
jgi:hypothetical protein